MFINKQQVLTRSYSPRILVPYVLTLIALLIGGLFPEGRVWGINWWAYGPTMLPVILFLIALAIPFVIDESFGRADSSLNAEHIDAAFWCITGGLSIVMIAVFWFLKNQTHFLGDGYTALSLLSADQPLIKGRELGESLTHIWVKQLFGSGKEAALASFRSISIGSGILYLLLIAAYSRLAMADQRKRVALFVGLCSGGYMLLFFGYVENYSLFVLSITCFCALGILILQNRIHRLWILVPLASSIWFHLFGLTMIPAGMYVVSGLIGPLRKLESRGGWYWPYILTLITIIATVAVGSLSDNYQVRLAFIPLSQNVFTVQSYTVFSGKHVIDLLNLAFILVPGALLLIVASAGSFFRLLTSSKLGIFLGVATLSASGAVFFLDPRLGMPRDWDLFSFVGIPLSFLLYHALINSRLPSKRVVIVSLLSAVLGFAVLLPRAFAISDHDTSLKHFANHASLDKIKNKNGRIILRDYYRNRGLDSLADEEETKYLADYSYDPVFIAGTQEFRAGNPHGALELFDRVLRIDPLYWVVWTNKGVVHSSLGQHAEAIDAHRIAVGLNPYHDGLKTSLAWAYQQGGQQSKAEDVWRRLVETDSVAAEALFGLGLLYAQRNEPVRAASFFLRMVDHPRSDEQQIKRAAEYLAERADSESLISISERALARGMDSLFFGAMLDRASTHMPHKTTVE